MKSPLQKVIKLVAAGAEINYTNEYNDFALREAILHEHYDVVYYLLNQGAKYDVLLFDRRDFAKDGSKIYFVNYLRELTPPLNSEAYKYKTKIVKFLSERGIDYYRIPIPMDVKRKIKQIYPDTWKEYIENILILCS